MLKIITDRSLHLAMIMAIFVGMHMHAFGAISDAPQALPSQGSECSVETDTVSFRVDYRVAKSVIDLSYMSNASAIDSLRRFVESVKADPDRTITRLYMVSLASPEGSAAFNELLVNKRFAALKKLIVDELGVEVDSITKRCITPEQKSMYAQAVAGKGDAASCNLYTKLRFAECDFVVETHVLLPEAQPEPEPVPEIVIAPEPAPEPEPEPVIVVEPEPLAAEPAYEYVNLKTNLLAWGMLVQNIAVEYEFASHWSVSVPFYYSGLNYFTRTVKFRTSMVQPELRYWLQGPESHHRVFFGAHLGIGYFNYALGGDYRYQDRSATSPAYGGGLACGYRLNLPWGKGDRWKLEMAIGAGVYRARYDKWANKANGQLVEGGLRKTFFGIDQAAVTLIYQFGLRR